MLGIDAKADPRLAGEASRVLAVALSLCHRLRKRVLALVDERSTTPDRYVMQIVAFVVDDHGDPRIAAQVGDPAAIPMPVHPDVIVTQYVVNDDLTGRAVWPER